jgi:sarcosine oxidase
VRVAVIGGGAMGAAAAWRLSNRGADVVCFDRHSPPHALGSSHGESRIIRTAYMEGAWYVPLVQEAFVMWRELEDATGADLLTNTGALMLGDPSSDAVRGARTSAAAHGLDIDLMDADVVRDRYPGHVVGQDEVGVLDLQAGFIRPEAAIGAMLSQVPAIKRETAVASISDVSGEFDRVVVAAGPWTPQLVDWLPLAIERQVMAWFQIETGVNWFSPDRFPVFIRQSGDSEMYGIPTLDGTSIKVARHHEGEPTDPDHVNREVTAADLDPVRDFVARYMRGVSTRVTRSLVCMYTNTPDRHFAIDFDPSNRRVIVVSACSGHGFKFAPVIGDIAADLALTGHTTRDISHFSFERFASGGLAHTR